MNLFKSLLFYFFLITLNTSFSQENEKPNILFISVDDLKPSIGSFGDDFAITPNIDKLSETSTVFLNNHTQLAICAASRVSFLTGLRPDKTKVWDLKTKMRDVNPTWSNLQGEPGNQLKGPPTRRTDNLSSSWWTFSGIGRNWTK